MFQFFILSTSMFCLLLYQFINIILKICLEPIFYENNIGFNMCFINDKIKRKFWWLIISTVNKWATLRHADCVRQIGLCSDVNKLRKRTYLQHYTDIARYVCSRIILLSPIRKGIDCGGIFICTFCVVFNTFSLRFCSFYCKLLYKSRYENNIFLFF